MKERPIIFQGKMVRAILDGRKTQTRRIIKPQPEPEKDLWYPDPGSPRAKHYGNVEHMIKGLPVDFSPYGQPGDLLYVREAFADIPETLPGNIHYKDSATEADLKWFKEEGWKWKRSIHMPKKYARIWLEVTGVRVERVQDINSGDAEKEGLVRDMSKNNNYAASVDLISRFRRLWNSIYAKRGFDWIENPWVWVIEFKPVKGV